MIKMKKFFWRNYSRYQQIYQDGYDRLQIPSASVKNTSMSLSLIYKDGNKNCIIIAFNIWFYGFNTNALINL